MRMQIRKPTTNGRLIEKCVCIAISHFTFHISHFTIHISHFTIHNFTISQFHISHFTFRVPAIGILRSHLVSSTSIFSDGLIVAAKRKICSPKIKCVLLQNRFREKESIEKDAFVPYSSKWIWTIHQWKYRNNGLNVSLHCIVFMLFTWYTIRWSNSPTFILYFQGVQTLLWK